MIEATYTQEYVVVALRSKFKKSGLSLRAFCEENGLGAHTYLWAVLKGAAKPSPKLAGLVGLEEIAHSPRWRSKS